MTDDKRNTALLGVPEPNLSVLRFLIVLLFDLDTSVFSGVKHQMHV